MANYLLHRRLQVFKIVAIGILSAKIFECAFMFKKVVASRSIGSYEFSEKYFAVKLIIASLHLLRKASVNLLLLQIFKTITSILLNY